MFHEFFEEHVVIYNFPESLVPQYGILGRSLVSSLGARPSGLSQALGVVNGVVGRLVGKVPQALGGRQAPLH